MGLFCVCPNTPALASISLSECSESFGQLQKVIFQRVFSNLNVRNFITDPTLLINWSPLLTANDSTKVVQSPYISAPVLEPGTVRTYGGGNESLNGFELNVGREPSGFTGNLLRLTQDKIKVLKTYQCENVGVWLVDEFGRIGCLYDNAKYYPIPILSLFVSDKSLGGLEATDKNNISWKFQPHWSDNFKIVAPSNFNVLTDLINTEASTDWVLETGFWSYTAHWNYTSLWKY